MNENWRDKTCEKCEYQIGGSCRRFPPSTGKYISVKYDDNNWSDQNIIACAEYKEKS